MSAPGLAPIVFEWVSYIEDHDRGDEDASTPPMWTIAMVGPHIDLSTRARAAEMLRRYAQRDWLIFGGLR